MVLYPPLCIALGLDPRTTGIMLGATIHDMAQVVGAGYAVSEPVGNTAVIVKLFRVFLLLPAVLVDRLVVHRARAPSTASAKVPVPVFALAFLGLCLVNSAAVAAAPASRRLYAPVKAALVQASTWGLLDRHRGARARHLAGLAPRASAGGISPSSPARRSSSSPS